MPDVLLNSLYRFISSVFPSGNENLKVDEVETIIKFKNGLGIDDPDATNMHIEVLWCYNFNFYNSLFCQYIFLLLWQLVLSILNFVFLAVACPSYFQTKA